jgi:hypothetical protein
LPNILNRKHITLNKRGFMTIRQEKIFPAYFSVIFLLILANSNACVDGIGTDTVDEDFEDGAYTGVPTQMKVLPQILEENGNKFLRITGSREDKQDIPSGESDRSRSTIRFTAHHGEMAVLTDANLRQTYSADLRVNTNGKATVFELFQHADSEDDSCGDEPYGARNGIGPTARFKGDDFYNCYNNENTCDKYTVKATPGKWHRYLVNALWSYDKNVARLEVYLDGVLIHMITGKPTNLGPNSNRIPELKLGLYGDFATGTIDLDNIRVGPWEEVPSQKVFTPTITPNGGTFVSSISVSLSTATSGAMIHYTIDGSTPTHNSQLYQNPITLTQTTVLKTFAMKDGMSDSNVATATFTKTGSLANHKFYVRCRDTSGNTNQNDYSIDFNTVR